MKRLLVVADDRALTKFVAEALLGRALGNGAAKANDTWDVARAHTGLEALLLVTRGGRTFDVVVIDQPLEDMDVLNLLSRLRENDDSKDVPVFLLSERGRDQHSRRLAAETYRVAGFIDKPVTTESLRAAFGSLERKRRIMLIESNREMGERYREALSSAGYLVEVVHRGRDGLDRTPRFQPDVVVSALTLEDMRGVDACVELKKSRTHSTVPVVLYGQISALGNEEISANAHRADDFIQAPFDDGILTERIGTLVGKGVSHRPRSKSSIRPVSIRRNSTEPEIDVDVSEAKPPTTTPPASASPSPVGRSKRATRRVPCNIKMSIRNGEKVYTSKTLDISHGGIFLATEEKLSIGEVIDMTFQIPSSDRVVSAVGKVAWVGQGGPGHATEGVGVKFSRIDPKDLQLIVEYVNRVSRVVYNAS
jgi:uncharacterized protein (TIGR02266 family)